MELSVQCKKLEKGQNKLEKTIKTNKDKDTNRRQRQNKKQKQKQTHENRSIITVSFISFFLI